MLAPGGKIAADSPNRLVTKKLGWDHPEHTVELTVEEIRELLGLAGFDDTEIRGVWLCYDPERDRVLPFDELGSVAGWDAERRAAEAADRPEDSFVWWAEATRAEREPDHEALNRRVHEAYDVYRAQRLSRMHHTVGSRREENGRKFVSGRRGQAGALLFGPYVPMRPGKWIARFRISAIPARWRSNPEPDEPLGSIDVTVGRVRATRCRGAVTHGARASPGRPRARAGAAVRARSDRVRGTIQVDTLGRVRMSARYPVEVE